MNTHHYQVVIKWTGNTGEGTTSYNSYSRSHILTKTDAGTTVHMSSDPAFRGDSSRYNPEELLIASVSSCHMLWYLHLASRYNMVVTDYIDHPTGIMVENATTGSGFIKSITLNPHVTITNSQQISIARKNHHKAHELCFIANSLKCQVIIDGTVIVG